MDERRWEQLVRRWLKEGHGPVLTLYVKRVPEDLRERLIVVDQNNALSVVTLVAYGAPYVFYDPNNYLDVAVRDKMLCVRGIVSEEKGGTKVS